MRSKTTGGITSYMLPIFVQDSTSTTGAGLGSLVYNSSGLVAEYRRYGETSWTAITLVSGATLGNFTSGGWVADGSLTGAYEVGIPNTAMQANAPWVVIRFRGATNMVPCQYFIELDAVAYSDATRFGLAALPNASANASGGLITFGTGSGQLNVASGNADANLKTWKGSAPADLASTYVQVDMIRVSGDSVAADNLEAALDGTGGVTITAGITGNVTGNLSGSVGSVTGNVGGNVVGSVASVTAVSSGAITSGSFASGAITAAAIAADAIGASELASDAVAEIVTGVLTTQMAEAYHADGSAPTVAQALHFLISALTEFSISGTTITMKKLDGSTTAATLTINSSTTPTSVTRAS